MRTDENNVKKSNTHTHTDRWIRKFFTLCNTYTSGIE